MTEKNLLAELRIQFGFFCENFHDGTTEKNDSLTNSLRYLDSLLSTNSTSDQEEGTANSQPNQNISVSTVDGKKTYFLDGKPIRFKVLKNKPKNGDFQKRWNHNYEILKRFKDNNGHITVTRATPGYEDLGNWVAEQRRKLKRGKVTLKQFETLTELGFEWDRSHYFHKTYQKKRKVEASS